VLYAFAFDRIGVVASDLYFVDPNPLPGQEGAEQGVRLEVRMFERGALRGSEYSAQPIEVDRPVWRADLLESVGRPGSLDRAHHHPRFTGWDPGIREFAEAMTADPLGWVGKRLEDLDGILEEAGLSSDEVGPDDAVQLREAAPDIIDAVGRLLDRVRAAGHGPADGAPKELTRLSWL
jgi:hypothetical protein